MNEEKIWFEQIHEPGSFNDSPFALLGEVKVFYVFNKYVLSAWYTSKSGKRHTLVIESEDEWDLLKKVIDYIREIPAPWDRDRALENILYAMKKPVSIDRITIRVKERNEERIAEELLRLIDKYGKAITLRSGSTNLYDDDIHCYECFEEDIRYGKCLYEKVTNRKNGRDEEGIWLLTQENEVVGLIYEYSSYYISGVESGGTRFIKVLPFRRIKVVKKCRGRFCKPAEVGYRQEYKEWKEEIELEPVSEDIKSKALELVNQILSLE